jgi:hypothetical protein
VFFPKNGAVQPLAMCYAGAKNQTANQISQAIAKGLTFS